jgi:hypothetical protein
MFKGSDSLKSLGFMGSGCLQPAGDCLNQNDNMHASWTKQLPGVVIYICRLLDCLLEMLFGRVLETSGLFPSSLKEASGLLGFPLCGASGH